MIRSVTEILMNDLEISDSYNQRSSDNICPGKKLGTLLATRFNCMQAWFIRCSRLEKFNYLTKMLQLLASVSSLSIILNTLLTCSGKASVYSIENNSDFVYDRGLNDHNRALHPVTLKQVQEDDLEWFSLLRDDSEQVLIFIGLLRLGGGLIIYEIYKVGVKLFYQRILPQPARVSKAISVASSRKRSSNVPFERNRLNIKTDTESYKVNPADPFVTNAVAKKKEWEDLVKRYKVEVDAKLNSGITLEKKPKSTKIKKKKKDKGSKGKGESDLDNLQLMPITLVKKIFSYLDNVTLRKIKKVNKYWAVVVKDLAKEQKGRKNLDTFIKAMQKDLDEVEYVDEYTVELEDEWEPSCGTSYPKKRIKKLFNRGAVLPQLVQPLREPYVADSWITNSNDLPEYILKVQNIKLFPRSFSTAPLLPKNTSSTALKRRYTVFEDLLRVFEDDEEMDDSILI